MPVRDLAPALLALGDIFVAASLALYPEREPVALAIKATDTGSFDVDLVLHVGSTWHKIVHLFSSDTATALSNLKDLVIGAGVCLFALAKAIGRRRIVAHSNVASGTVKITLEDGTIMEVPTDVLALYRNIEVRHNVRRFVEPMSRDGVDTIEFRSEGETTLRLEKADVPAYDVPEPMAIPLSDAVTEMHVELTSAVFAEGLKWRFSRGGEDRFTADMIDADFLRRVDQGEAFHKGDTLRCRMRVSQVSRDGKLHTDYQVVQVIQHIPRQAQLNIPDALPPPDVG
jgi:hypothetical protein